MRSKSPGELSEIYRRPPEPKDESPSLQQQLDEALEALRVFVDNWADETGASCPHYDDVNRARTILAQHQQKGK